MRGLFWLALGACYSPSIQTGVPCSPDSPYCPDGQTCMASASGYQCEPVGGTTPDARAFDAARPDVADPDGDDDGDGVPNGSDNCPEVANPDQHDEDGDGYGDVCDPCPVTANAVEVDSDGDGVGDSCDPNPSTQGDHAYLFASFANGVPTGTGWDPFGTWMGGGDAISIAVDASHANIGYTMPTTGKERLWTKVTLTATGATAMAIGGGGLADEKGASGNSGIACYLYVDTVGAAKLGIVDTSTSSGTELASKPFAWLLGTAYELVETRDGTSYTCATGTTSVSVTSSATFPMPEVGFVVTNASATFAHLFVVTSP